MTTTNFKIKEIAPQIGFEDEKRFMKMFKKQEARPLCSIKDVFQTALPQFQMIFGYLR